MGLGCPSPVAVIAPLCAGDSARAETSEWRYLSSVPTRPVGQADRGRLVGAQRTATLARASPIPCPACSHRRRTSAGALSARRRRGQSGEKPLGRRLSTALWRYPRPSTDCPVLPTSCRGDGGGSGGRRCVLPIAWPVLVAHTTTSHLLVEPPRLAAVIGTLATPPETVTGDLRKHPSLERAAVHR